MAAKLTDTAIKARQGVKFGILFLVFIMIARALVGAGQFIYKNYVPKPTEPPTIGFGPLPQLPFPQSDILASDLVINVETASGSLPNFPGQTKVYFMPQATTTLFSLENARSKANSIGFTATPIEINPTVYRFLHPDIPATLEMDIVNNSFSVSYNLAADPTPLEDLPPTAEDAEKIARGILSNMKLSQEDITGDTTSEFLKVEGQNLVSALSLSEADLTRVNLFRKDYDEIGPITPDPNRSNIWFILSGAKRDRQLIAAEYHYFPIDEEQFHTYPLKSASQAVDELTSGQAYIASLGLNTGDQVTVRRVYLAYYDPDEPTEFYQPVYVFEGDKGFYAYVQAVSNEYVEKAPSADTLQE